MLNGRGVLTAPGPETSFRREIPKDKNHKYINMHFFFACLKRIPGEHSGMHLASQAQGMKKKNTKNPNVVADAPILGFPPQPHVSL